MERLSWIILGKLNVITKVLIIGRQKVEGRRSWDNGHRDQSDVPQSWGKGL